MMNKQEVKQQKCDTKKPNQGFNMRHDSMHRCRLDGRAFILKVNFWSGI